MLKSKLLDVDSLLPQKTPEQAKAEAQEQAQKNDKPGESFDAEKTAQGPISAMKKNPMARALDFTAHAAPWK